MLDMLWGRIEVQLSTPLQVFDVCVWVQASGGRWWPAVASVTALLMPLHQMKASPRSRDGGRAGSWRMRFLSTAPQNRSLSNPRLPPIYPPTIRPWHLRLNSHFGSKRGLTKVSMATVQSVNHAATDVSSPSLFALFFLSPSHPSFMCRAPPFSSCTCAYPPPRLFL